MNICVVCNLPKDDDQFIRRKRTGRLGTKCLACHANKLTPQKHLDSIKRRNRASRARFDQWLMNQKCVDCGEPDMVVLELDHVRGEKAANVSDLVKNGRKWEVIEAEIAKCEVRCANCHRRKTALRNAKINVYKIPPLQEIHPPLERIGIAS